jgi:hypothetical protein
MFDSRGFEVQKYVIFLSYLWQLVCTTWKPGQFNPCNNGFWAGFDSQQRQEIFLFSTASRLTLKFTQPPTQWVLEERGSFQGLKCQKCESDHSLSSSTGFKNGGVIPPLLHMSSWGGAQLIKHVNHFTLPLPAAIFHLLSRFVLLSQHITKLLLEQTILTNYINHNTIFMCLIFNSNVWDAFCNIFTISIHSEM